MMRYLVGILSALLVLGLAVSDVDAQKKKKRNKKKADKTPTSEEIAKSMGDLKWGMSKDDVMKLFIGRVKEEYRPKVAKTHDAVKEDQLRQEAKSKIQRIKEGYVEFSGRSTGWDVSFLKGEFAHNNDESMLVVRDGNSQNFYFFAGDRLWKWYKAFDASVFPANSFKTFAGAVQKRFGEAKDVEGELRPGDGSRHWLEWQDKGTRLRAVDQTDFYGFYCLVFEEKDTVDRLAKSRPAPGSDSKGHALVDSVTDYDGTPETSANVVDRITGKRRVREDAPAQASTKSSKKSKKSGSSISDDDDGSSPPTGVSADDDPLSGLGL